MARGGGGGVAARKSRNGGKGKAKRGLDEQYFRKKSGFQVFRAIALPCAVCVQSAGLSHVQFSLTRSINRSFARLYDPRTPRGLEGGRVCTRITYNSCGYLCGVSMCAGLSAARAPCGARVCARALGRRAVCALSCVRPTGSLRAHTGPAQVV